MPTADLGPVQLVYDTFGSPDGEPLLLIQGLGVQMIGWRPGMCRLLASRGYYVVRFDNRDVGLSSRHPAAPLTLLETVVRSRLARSWDRGAAPTKAPYLLDDMARDAVGLLDHLGLDSAHVVGVSMGGMIAQTMAIRFPRRVRSLCSIMSSAAPEARPPASLRTTARLLWLAVDNSPQRMVDRQVELLRLVGTRRYFCARRARAYFEAAITRSDDRSGVPRQLGAVFACPDRRAELRRLAVPTAVIHGAQDPVISPAAGWATARAVPDARWELIEHLAHDLPEPLWPRFARTIDENASRARALAA